MRAPREWDIRSRPEGDRRHATEMEWTLHAASYVHASLSNF